MQVQDYRQKHRTILTSGQLEKKGERMVLKLVIPQDDEWFKLRVDYDKNPMDVIREIDDIFVRTDYPPVDWEYLNPELRGRQTLRVKLIRLGYLSSIAEARQKANALGYCFVGGQAWRPLIEKFPRPFGKGRLIVFGGSEWRGPDGRIYVVCLEGIGGKWRLIFCYPRFPFYGYWRWLVTPKLNTKSVSGHLIV